MNKKYLSLALAACLASPAVVIASSSTVYVTTGADKGKGSLRAALFRPASKIVIVPSVTEIVLDRPLVYRRLRPLTIEGSGQTISTSYKFDDSHPLLTVKRGADFTASDLTFQAPGGYGIENQGGSNAVFVQIPAWRKGTVSVRLTDTNIFDSGDHGLLVSDCSLGGACGGGQGGGGEGSDASIYLSLTRVHVEGVGFGKQDGDGVRVNDRGAGDIIFDTTDSEYRGNGADGVELDEGDEGDVIINVRNSSFSFNGAYCDLTAAELAKLDPNCLDEDNEPDLDDAFDIDEAGPGGITGVVSNVVLDGNLDEGLDFDAEGDGDGNIDLDLNAISNSMPNIDEDIKVSEEGTASVAVKLAGIDVLGDVEVEEENDGDLNVILYSSTVGDDLKLSQENPGTGEATLVNTVVGGETDASNVTVTVLP